MKKSLLIMGLLLSLIGNFARAVIFQVESGTDFLKLLKDGGIVGRTLPQREKGRVDYYFSRDAIVYVYVASAREFELPENVTVVDGTHFVIKKLSK